MIQVVHRALNIIEYVAATGRKDVSLTEISNHLQLNAGTCANIIKTLVQREYLTKNGKKGYGLGPIVHFLTGESSYSIDIINASRESLKILKDKINENCMIGILKGDTRITLFEAYADHELQVINKTEKKAVQTASGRLLIAFLKEPKLNDYLNSFGLPSVEEWEGVQTVEDFKKELLKIREKGYAIQLANSGILGIAMPVYKNNEVIAGVGVFLPKIRFEEETKKLIISHLKATSDKISKGL